MASGILKRLLGWRGSAPDPEASRRILRYYLSQGLDFRDKRVVVIGAGGSAEMGSLLLEAGARMAILVDPELPPGIAAFDYAPHNLVMPRARVVVHQGGIGTTGQALRSGRPMLVVPHGQDQPDNARRCAGLGVGLSVDVKRYTTPRVVRLLRQLIDEPA